ncbi:MAG: caspase family protein [Chloroflexota bacterium]|nr:caspase family protein [Chloroflexota bacterium]
MSDFTSTAHALLIGVGDYTHPRFASLPATVSDAHAIATVLTDPTLCGYPPANVHTITGPDATAASIRTALESLARSTNSQSTVFLYFSGHGGRGLTPPPAAGAATPSPLLPGGRGEGDGGRGEGHWRAYLCPREADPDDLAHTAIPGDDFSALLAAIPARKLLVMLDACHAAGSASLKAAGGALVWKAGLPDDYYEALSQGSGRVVIASSKEDQFSYVRPQGDLSLFTHHLREALGGKAAVRDDGLIHVLDVFHYVNEAVHTDEPKQTPILKVKDLDMNFPIALDRGGGKGTVPTPAAAGVAAIREQIVSVPIAGAKALSDYLAVRPEWAARRNEVDLKRAELKRIQHDLDLFGPNPSDQAAKNRAVFFLLRVCLELEQPER